MPDVSEGLTSDVDSDAGFTAALAQQAGVEVSQERLDGLATEDRSIAAGLSAGLEASGQPRDEGGRFAPAATESGEGTPEGGPAEGQPAEGEPVDPAVTALLEKHGGDANAALAALAEEHANAQSLIGRQGQELGDARALRDQVAHLEGQLEALMSGAASPATLPSPVASDEIVEGLESMLDEHGSDRMMGWVIDNRPDLIDTAIEVWQAEDPVAAARFAVRYEHNLAADTQPAQAEQQLDPVMEGVRQEVIFSQTVDAARQGLQIGEQEWPAIRDHVIPAFQDATTSPLVKNAIVSDDPATRQQGMEALLQLARGRAISAAGAEATAQAGDAAAQAAASRKAAAQVITGSLRPTERQPGEEMTPEERVAAFHKRLLDSETTSVEEGLRRGAAQPQ